MPLKCRWLAFCRRARGAAGQGGPPKPGGAAGQAGPLEAGGGREGEAAAEAAFAELDWRYREPGRHYHNWRHVAACLRELRRARAPDGVALALELAVWFHDAVYEPGRGDNEEASAELALRWSEALGLAPELGRRAAGLILATRHSEHAPQPGDRAEALLQDIDLAVLGAGWAAFRRYERGIAQEYAGLPPAAFREGRAMLLREFLARPALYATAGSRRRLERRARRNLAGALARLEGGRPICRGRARRSAGRAGHPDRR
jgi:predicted metal-dependent HD superfamily phosphohydrolase